MRETVLVTGSEYRKGQDIFRQANGWRVLEAPAAEEALAAMVLKEQARAVVLGVGRYSGPLYRALKETGSGRGSVLARFGVGHDGVDKTLARQNGIVVCNTPGVLDLSVAEHVFWLMGNLARGICPAQDRLRAGDFNGPTGSELAGKRLGIVGFGRIGRRVAAIAHFGFGMHVLAGAPASIEEMERTEKAGFDEIRRRYGLAAYTTAIDEVFSQSDYVSIHLPSVPETHHYVNTARLALMKPAAALINTARGPVLDEIALYDALASGRLAGAALDVFEREPYVPRAPDKDLRRLHNLVLTPHVGSNTREANQRMAEACVANLEHFFHGNFDQLTQVRAG